MLGQLRELKKLRQIKKQMEEVEITEEYAGIKIKMNGAMEVISVKIDDPEDPKLEKYMRKCFNRALRNVQKSMMSNMGGLSGMLGG